MRIGSVAAITVDRPVPSAATVSIALPAWVERTYTSRPSVDQSSRNSLQYAELVGGEMKSRGADATSWRFVPSRLTTKRTDKVSRLPVRASLLPSRDQFGPARKLHCDPHEMVDSTVPSLRIILTVLSFFAVIAIVKGGMPGPFAPAGTGTVTVAKELAPFDVAPMVALPGPTAVSSPDDETVTAVAFELTHEMAASGTAL